MTTRLSTEEYLSALERSTADVARLSARLDPTDEVPSCPGWTVRDVVAHLGGVHGWARGVIAGGSPKDPRPEPEGELSEWYADQAAQVLEILRSADPQAQAWTFSAAEPTVGFWHRRQAHESEMHRIDLLLAAGENPAYADELAVDAITEVLDLMLPRMHSEEKVPVTGTIRLIAGDTGDQWLLRPSDEAGAVDYTHSTMDGSEQADVTATAPANDLITGLWGRTPYRLWSIDGDRAVLDTLMSSTITP